MTTNANQNGKMNAQRVEAIKAFIRQAEGSSGTEISKQAAGMGLTRKDAASSEARELGLKLFDKISMRYADTDKIRELIRQGAEVDVKDLHGRTPLMMAVLHKHAEVVKMLLSNGAEVNMTDKNGWTALMRATWNNSDELAKILLHNGADASMKDKDGRTAADHTIKNSIKKLLENAVKAK